MSGCKTLNKKVLYYLNIYSESLRQSWASSTFSCLNLIGLTKDQNPRTVDALPNTGYWKKTLYLILKSDPMHFCITLFIHLHIFQNVSYRPNYNKMGTIYSPNHDLTWCLNHLFLYLPFLFTHTLSFQR